VQRGVDAAKELRAAGPMDEQTKKTLFGQTAQSTKPR